MRSLIGAAASIAFAAFGLVSGASASTLKPLELAVSPATCSVSDFTIGEADASMCEGAYRGNDSNSELDGIFDINGWTEIAKVEMRKNRSGSFTTGSLTVNRNGTWSVSSWGNNSPVMAVIKGGNTFSAYLLGDLTATFGTWNTDGVLKGNNRPGPGLSHLTIYSGDPTPTPIPLPAAGWMLLAGLGGLVAMRRRKAVNRSGFTGDL